MENSTKTIMIYVTMLAWWFLWIDPGTFVTKKGILGPFQTETICESVRKTVQYDAFKNAAGFRTTKCWEVPDGQFPLIGDS